MKSAKPRVKVYKPTRFGEGMQPGTVESELNRRRARKDERQAKLHLAELDLVVILPDL
jgi:hypothetical protein